MFKFFLKMMKGQAMKFISKLKEFFKGEEVDLEQKQREAKERNKRSNERMKNKFCPIINNLCLGEKCIHFGEADYEYVDHPAFGSIMGLDAHCKLWSD